MFVASRDQIRAGSVLSTAGGVGGNSYICTLISSASEGGFKEGDEPHQGTQLGLGQNPLVETRRSRRGKMHEHRI